jgi:probable O-glycosylation ligase (exosortase A-associated)
VSIAYYGVKGGAFMVVTGGNYIVFGPPETMIEDNNNLAIALVMIAPILNYLRAHTQNKIIKMSVLGALLLLLASVLGSYSRGGLVALAAMLGYLWIKSKTKAATFMLAVLAFVGVFVAMPDKYMERISTISSAAQTDESFRGRLDAWEVAWETALDRPLGAGFDGPRQFIIWNRYLPEATARASHSIYFMVLGEHGFIGLTIYLFLILATWLNLWKVQKITDNDPDLQWAADLSRALQVSLVGFCVGGAALPMAYYDGFFSLLAVCPALLNITERLARAKAKNPADVTSQRLPLSQTIPATAS